MEINKRKMFIVLLFFALFLIFFSTKSSATCDFTYNDVQYSLKDNAELNGNEGYSSHVLVVCEDYVSNNSSLNGKPYCFIFNGDWVGYSNFRLKLFSLYGNLRYGLFGTDSDGNEQRLTDGSTLYVLDGKGGSLYRSSISFLPSDNEHIVSSSVNIYNDSDELVFQVTPQTVLAPIMKEAPLVEVLKEILEILPIVIITIVGLISLRKGLQLLSTVLHRS